MARQGLEHHRSSEDTAPSGYFTDWKDCLWRRDLLPHEYVHSWNGKYRRPKDLWTPDYRTPMRDSLLWVYEGQTMFWGIVLAARSGISTHDEAIDAIGGLAALQETSVGRRWRPLQDTTHDPIIAARRPQGWTRWQRSEDYYTEGLLIWLDVDSLMRDLSKGTRSLDDFARDFFGGKDGDWGVVSYTSEHVVQALSRVQPYDWEAFLRKRLELTSESAPLDGIIRGGYRLVFTNAPTDWFKAWEKDFKITDLSYSGGFSVGEEGEITEVLWDSAAFNAGLTVGSKLIAVNGKALDVDKLKAAIKARKTPLTLLVKTGDSYRTTELNYDGGLRYPKLERIASGPSNLDALLSPRQ